MAKTSSLALGPDGDLDRSRGGFRVATGVEYLLQKVRQRLQFFRGEWHLDVTGVGFPYYQEILGKKQSDLSTVRSFFLKEILNTQGIATVDELTVSLNSARRLLVSWKGTGDLGQLLVDTFEGPIL